MWPFPRTLHRWYDDALRRIEAELDSGKGAVR
jgi:hypothetical protein